MDSKDRFPWSSTFGSGNGNQFGGDKVTMPPPVSMSLRARESSAMSLKRIFDQINGSASARDESTASPQTREPAVGGYQVIRNHSLPDLRSKFPSETDFSFSRRDPEHVVPVPALQPAFGSPISISKDTTTPSQSSSEQSSGINWSNTKLGIKPLHHHTIVPQTSSISRPNPATRPQSTAQLTIFYSGNVNVYDNVPADKAHAIMILAGNSSPANSNPNITVEKERYNPPTLHNTTIINTGKNIAENVVTVSSPSVSPSPSTPLITPPSPSPSVPTDSKPQASANGAIKRPAQSGMELPHARKASLARFLEKRKDRQVQQQHHNVNENPKPAAECSAMDSHPISGTALLDMAMSNKKPCLAQSSSSHFTNKITVDQGDISKK